MTSFLGLGYWSEWGISRNSGGLLFRRPERVDCTLGVRAALAGERDQRRHRGIDLGERELGRDEPGLESCQREPVGEPELCVVPAVARGARGVAAATCSDHDEIAAAEQALLCLL